MSRYSLSLDPITNRSVQLRDWTDLSLHSIILGNPNWAHGPLKLPTNTLPRPL